MVIEPLMTRYGLIPLATDAVGEIVETCLEPRRARDLRRTGFRFPAGPRRRRVVDRCDAGCRGLRIRPRWRFPHRRRRFQRRRAATPNPAAAISSPPRTRYRWLRPKPCFRSSRTTPTYDRLEERSAQLADGILNLADRFHRSIVVNRVGSVFALYLGVKTVSSVTAARRADAKAYRRLVSGLRDEGVLFPPVPGDTGFVSSAHGAKDIEETLAAVERVLLKVPPRGPALMT